MIRQQLLQKQRLKILPQQIQLLNFFHLNTLELEQRIRRELEDNPLLEETTSDTDESPDTDEKDNIQDYQDWEEYGYDDIPDYKMEYGNYIHNDRLPSTPVAEAYDFHEDLKQQFRFLYSDEQETALADYLIDSLNECGMLETPVERIAEDLSFKLKRWIESEEVEMILHRIQQLEPAGIGSRDTQECLLIQLHAIKERTRRTELATRLIRDHFNDLRQYSMEKIKSQLHIDENGLKDILELVATLKVKPLTETTTGVSVNQHIVPDFLVLQDGEDLEVQLYRQRSDSLHINTGWKEMIQGKARTEDKATRQYLKNKLQSAQWFISAVQQREATMQRIMNAIVRLQRSYFLTGDITDLKPMILKDIARIVQVDISTVSRVTSNKYVETAFGTLLLKDLFTEGIANEKGKVISNKVIQHAIEEVIAAEDKKHPYTDQQLVSILAKRGFSIARRTVAKYREQLRIPVSHLRGLWA